MPHLKKPISNRFLAFSCDEILENEKNTEPIICVCTDKKENQIFLTFKEIKNGAVAKSYMRKAFLI